MGKIGKRIAALAIALLFLGTSVGFSVLVILQIRGENRQSQDTANTESQINKEDALQGKKLENFTPMSAVDSLQKIDLSTGTGAEAKAGDTVTVNYTGALAKDGTIFESSLDSGQPATFGLGQVIKGWSEGIPGMKVGGKRRLVIPSGLAYGESGSGSSIPPNSDLVFDVELLGIGSQQ